MSNSKWQKYLIPVYSEAVPRLADALSGKLLDKLLERGLLTLERYSTIRKTFEKEKRDKAARNLFEILMRRGGSSFDTFCDVVGQVDEGDRLLNCLLPPSQSPIPESVTDGFTGTPFATENQEIAASSESHLKRPMAIPKTLQFSRSQKRAVLPKLPKPLPSRSKTRNRRLLLKRFRSFHSELPDQTGSASSVRLTPECSISDSNANVLCTTSPGRGCQPIAGWPERKLSNPVDEEIVWLHVDSRLRHYYAEQRTCMRHMIKTIASLGQPRRVKIRVKDGIVQDLRFLKQNIKHDARYVEVPSKKCLLRVTLPRTSQTTFHHLARFCKAMKIRRNQVEIRKGSCILIATLPGQKFIEFICNLQDTDNFTWLAELDCLAEIELGNLTSVSLVRLFLSDTSRNRITLSVIDKTVCALQTGSPKKTESLPRSKSLFSRFDRIEDSRLPFRITIIKDKISLYQDLQWDDSLRQRTILEESSYFADKFLQKLHERKLTDTEKFLAQTKNKILSSLKKRQPTGFVLKDYMPEQNEVSPEMRTALDDLKAGLTQNIQELKVDLQILAARLPQHLEHEIEEMKGVFKHLVADILSARNALLKRHQTAAMDREQTKETLQKVEATLAGVLTEHSQLSDIFHTIAAAISRETYEESPKVWNSESADVIVQLLHVFGQAATSSGTTPPTMSNN
eukprot:m.210835 g.210835  ORF g.210835 m.210835 type:complete len:682 (+) comp39747_c0_seq10:38-2083(+)